MEGRKAVEMFYRRMELRREAWAGDMDLFGSHLSRGGNGVIKLRGSPKSVCQVNGKRKEGLQRKMGRRGRRLTMVSPQPPRGGGGSREPWLRLQEHKLGPKTYPHGFPTRWPLEILGEPLHRAGSGETPSGLVKLGEETGERAELLEQAPSSLLSQGDYLCSQEPPK